MTAAKGRGGKRPSMFEVAKLAGVSHQTVSRVINHSPDVSEATRAKVQAAIDGREIVKIIVRAPKLVNIAVKG